MDKLDQQTRMTFAKLRNLSNASTRFCNGPHDIVWNLVRHSIIPDYTTKLISFLGVCAEEHNFNCYNLVIQFPNFYHHIPSRTPDEIIKFIEDIKKDD